MVWAVIGLGDGTRVRGQTQARLCVVGTSHWCLERELAQMQGKRERGLSAINTNNGVRLFTTS